MNGAISPFTAGELAKAAFNNGYEEYGWDIVKRFIELVKRDGTTYFLYDTDGKLVTRRGTNASGYCRLIATVKEGQRCLIVDDFLKAGGTAKGMIDLMSEFNVQVVGTAFVMATAHNANRVIEGEKALMIMDEPENGKLSIRPADWL